MTVNDIFAYLCELFPLSDACDFDNPGLLVGDQNKPVDRVLLALDVTNTVLDRAVELGVQLIVTHHPVIFEPLRNVCADSLVYSLIKKDLSVISMHTNMDIGTHGVNDCLAQALGLCNVVPVDDGHGFLIRCGSLKEPTDADDFAAFIGRRLDTAVKYVGSGVLQKIALCSGSGADFLPLARQIGADALVTADVKHHQFLEASQHGIALYDAGHFPSEDVVLEPLCRMLEDRFPEMSFHVCHDSDIKICVNI